MRTTCSPATRDAFIASGCSREVVGSEAPGSMPGGPSARVAGGSVHNLPKRTALSGTYSRIQNRNGAALSGGGVTGVANATWTGLDLGVRHTF